MAQTLALLTTPSSPPTLSESNTLMANVSAIQNLNERQIMGIRILALAYWLVAVGGDDYTGDYPGLIEETQNLLGGDWNVIVDPFDKGIEGKIEAIIDWNSGRVASGGSPSADVQTLVNSMGILVEYPVAVLYKVVLFLKYKISVAL